MGWTWLKQRLGLQPADAPLDAPVVTPTAFANQLDEVCAKYGAVYLRTALSPQEVQIMLVRNDGTLSAVGATTQEAVAAIAIKADKCWGAL